MLKVEENIATHPSPDFVHQSFFKQRVKTLKHVKKEFQKQNFNICVRCKIVNVNLFRCASISWIGYDGQGVTNFWWDIRSMDFKPKI